MLTPDQVSAVLVTRGDVDLGPVVESLPFDDVVVYDNARPPRGHGDNAVFGRYAGIARAKHDVIYVQDDDCILEPDAFDRLLAAYEPGAIVANMPERFRPHYPDSCLVGFGAIFDRGLPALAFARFGSWTYAANVPVSRSFHRTCDVVFTALTPLKLLDLPYADREFATAPSRMYRQPGHVAERARMLELARRVRDAKAAA